MHLREADIERYWERVDKRSDGECWPWLGADIDGYGRAGRYAAHRVAYFLAHGSIPPHHPKTSMICHSCNYSLCVNPRHLYHGTAKDNSRDAIKSGRHRTARGEQCKTARLTERLVIICRKLNTKGHTVKSLALRCGVSEAAMREAINGKTWAHIGEESPPKIAKPHVDKKFKIKQPDEKRALAIIHETLVLGRTVTDVAREHGLNRWAVSDIKNGRAWKHLPRPYSAKKPKMATTLHTSKPTKA